MPKVVLWTCLAALALSTVAALASPEGAFAPRVVEVAQH